MCNVLNHYWTSTVGKGSLQGLSASPPEATVEVGRGCGIETPLVRPLQPLRLQLMRDKMGQKDCKTLYLVTDDPGKVRNGRHSFLLARAMRDLACAHAHGQASLHVIDPGNAAVTAGQGSTDHAPMALLSGEAGAGGGIRRLLPAGGPGRPRAAHQLHRDRMGREHYAQ